MVPIPKNGSSMEAMFLLSVVSKVLEKHILSLIILHLENHCPLPIRQWGFHPRRSTSTALASTLYNRYHTMNSREEVLATFVTL